MGDSRTIVTNPFTTTHSKLPIEDKVKLGITPGLFRCSIGLENAGDILGDLKQAVKKAFFKIKNRYQE